jgi:hypothetical protein
MQARPSWQVAVQRTARKSQQLVAYLFNGPDDPAAWAELARLTAAIRRAAARHGLDELERVAASVATIAAAGVIDGPTAAELDAAMDRLLVLTDRASQALEPVRLPEDEDGIGPLGGPFDEAA